MLKFNTTEQDAIGAYGFTKSQRDLQHKTGAVRIMQFKTGLIYPHNFTYTLDPNLEEGW